MNTQDSGTLQRRVAGSMYAPTKFPAWLEGSWNHTDNANSPDGWKSIAEWRKRGGNDEPAVLRAAEWLNDQAMLRRVSSSDGVVVCEFPNLLRTTDPAGEDLLQRMKNAAQSFRVFIGYTLDKAGVVVMAHAPMFVRDYAYTGSLDLPVCKCESLSPQLNAVFRCDETTDNPTTVLYGGPLALHDGADASPFVEDLFGGAVYRAVHTRRKSDTSTNKDTLEALSQQYPHFTIDKYAVNYADKLCRRLLESKSAAKYLANPANLDRVAAALKLAAIPYPNALVLLPDEVKPALRATWDRVNMQDQLTPFSMGALVCLTNEVCETHLPDGQVFAPSRLRTEVATDYLGTIGGNLEFAGRATDNNGNPIAAVNVAEDPNKFSELKFAAAFVAAHRDRVVFVGTPRAGYWGYFHRCAGTPDPEAGCWRIDPNAEGLVRDLVRDFVRNGLPNESKQTKRLVDNIMAEAAWSLHQPHDYFDNNPNTIGVGTLGSPFVVDLAGDGEPRRMLRTDRISKLGTMPATQVHPDFLRMLSELCTPWNAPATDPLSAARVEVLRQWCGAALFGRVFPWVLLLQGPTRNGKSMFLSGFQTVLGEYADTFDGPSFFGENPHPTGKDDLRGKRFAWHDEWKPGVQLHTGILKAWTGGGLVKSRRMGKDFTPSWKPQAALALTTNNDISIASPSGADEYRFVRVEFQRQYLDNDLRAWDRWHDLTPSMMRWAIDAAREVHSRVQSGKPAVVVPEALKDEAQRWVFNSSPELEWLRDMVEATGEIAPDSRVFIPVADLVNERRRAVVAEHGAEDERQVRVSAVTPSSIGKHLAVLFTQGTQYKRFQRMTNGIRRMDYLGLRWKHDPKSVDHNTDGGGLPY